MGCGVSSLNALSSWCTGLLTEMLLVLDALVSWLKKFLVHVLVGCLVACCTVVILAWSKIPDKILLWFFFAALDVVIIAALWLGRREIIEMYRPGKTGRITTAQTRPLTPNLVNTILTATLTAAILPVMFWALWRPSLLKEVLVLTRDQVPSTYYPSFAVLHDVDWTSQAELTLDSPPKCFVGWMREGVATCDAVESGDECDCGANWENTISQIQWRNTTYNKLAWITTQDMVNVVPTTPVLAQAFFNYNTTRAFGDSFQDFSPSLWLAVWDPMLSLEESLEYGYTRLQLIDASSIVSVSLDLRRMEMLDKKAAYEYRLASISSVPSNSLTCDLGSLTSSYYGPCHVTLLIQFPTFEREVISMEREMAWSEIAAVVGSWLALFQAISWVLSLAALRG